MKRTILAAIAALALAGSASAQATLTKSATLPLADGTVSAGEYQYQDTVRGMKVYATLGTDDTLYMAVQASTAGWVGIGVGGLVMNGSRLFMASILDGKPSFIEKAGVGHFYADAKSLVTKKWAVKTADGTTTLELSIPSSSAVWKGQVNATFAYAKSANLSSKHGPYASMTFAVK